MDNTPRSLSPRESQLVLQLEWDDRKWVDREEILRFYDHNENIADAVIRSLRQKSWLERIGPGRYMLIGAERGPEGIPHGNLLAIAGSLVEPSYLAFGTAAEIHELTSQTRHTIWVASTKRVHPKQVRGTEIRFVFLKEDKFFGSETATILGESITVAGLEKTLLDCVDKPEYAGGIGEVARIMASAAGSVDWNTITAFSRRMDSQALVQRFGFLADFVGANVPDRVRGELHALVSRNSRPQLGAPSRWGTAGTLDPEWKLMVNVPDSELTAELPHLKDRDR